MKKNILILLFISICFQTLFGQSKTKDDNRFEGYTLEEAKAELEHELWNIEMFQDLMEMFVQDKQETNIQKDTENVEEIDATEAYIIYDNIAIQDSLNNYFEQLTFKQTLKEPISEMNIEQLRYAIPKFIDNKGEYDIYQPLLTVNKIFFAEETTSEDQEEFEFPIRITNKKFADSVSVNISYTYPTKVKKIILSEADPKYILGEDYIELSILKNKNAKLTVTDSLRYRICAVYAHTKLGDKLVSPISNLWISSMNDTIQEYIKQAVDIYKELITNLEKNKYSNIDEFNRDYWKKAPEYPEKKKEDEINNASFDFTYAIQSLEIYYAESFEDYSANFTLKNEELQQYQSTKFYIATGTNDSIGIVDVWANWIIDPIYYSLEYIGGVFFEGKLSQDDLWRTFKLDTLNKHLVECDFETITILPDGLLVIAQLEDNNTKAVIKTDGSIVIPIKKQHINSYRNEKMFVVEYEDKQKIINKLFDFSGKQLLPKSYYNIQIAHGYIYITPTKDAKKTIVYNADLKQISTNSWVQVQKFDKAAGLFIIEDNKGNVFCADKDGNVIITPSKEYTIIDTFNQGRCLCIRETEHGSKFGFINTIGQIVIPIEYDHARRFVGNYAYAEKDNEAMLIDLDNNIHVKLPASIQSSFVNNNNPKETRYHLENGYVYDGNGNFVEDEKN